MPLLAALLSGLFSGLFEFFAKRLTINLALTAAFIGSSAAALLAVKASLAGLGVFAAHTLPAPLVTAFSLILPSDFSAIVTAIWIGDTVLTSYGYWKAAAQVVYQNARA